MGELDPGDINKVKKAIEAYGIAPGGESEGGASDSLCLDSDGGSYIEGVEIAKLIYERSVATVIDEDMKCLSACAWIFMAGRSYGYEWDYVNRRMHVQGVLGFHAPYLTVPPGQYDQGTVESAYLGAILAISKVLGLANKNNYLSSEPQIRSSLIQEMLLHDRDRMLYVDTVDKAGRWNITLFGYSPETLSKRTAYISCANFLSWRMDSSSDTNQSYFYPGEDVSLDSVSVKPPVQSNDGLNSRDILTVTLGGMEEEWCDISMDPPDIDSPTVSICAVSVDREYGTNCRHATDAFGMTVPAYATFLPSRQLSSLPPASPSGAPSTSGSNFGSKAFIVIPGRDVRGDDYSVVRGIDRLACEELCRSGDPCKAFTYDNWNRVCFLKSTMGVIRRDPRSAAGILSSETIKEDTLPEVIQKRRSKAFPDRPYSEFKVGNYDQCSGKCLSDSQCDGFNFARSVGLCSLVKSPSEYADSRSSDLGIKIQPP